MTSKVYDLSEVSETLTLTQDGWECQAAPDERDYPQQITSLLHLSLQKHAENDTSLHRAAIGVRPPPRKIERSRLEDRIWWDHNWGGSFCFQVQLEQMVHMRVQSEKQNMRSVANIFEAVGLENITYT